jgi:hypothetical protein
VVAGEEPAAAFAGAARCVAAGLFLAQQELRKTLRQGQLADSRGAMDQQGMRQPLELAGELIPSGFL